MPTSPRLFLVFALASAGCGPTRSTPGNNPPPGDDVDLALPADEDAGVPGEDMAGQPPRDMAGQPPPDLAGAGDMAMMPPPQNCPQQMRIEPADYLFYVDGVRSQRVTYKVFCGNFDIAALATLTVDDANVGGFAGAVFTTAVMADGKTTVRAKLGNSMAQTSVTVKRTQVVIGPNTPMDAPMRFGGQNDPNAAPQWVYPDEGVLIPPNLSELEFQFLPKGKALFELRFAGGGLDFKVYTTCNTVGQGCAFTLDDPSWRLLSTASRGQPITVTLRGTGLMGGTVGTSPARRVLFTEEDVTGGIYYWAASPGGVVRYDFGLRGQKGENFYGPAQAGAICVGCHALSRDGSKIAVGLNQPGPATMQILDVAQRKVQFQLGNGFLGGGSNYQAFTPDGAKIITTETGGLTVRDSLGNLLSKNPEVANANMPDVSPDGTMVVFSRGDPTCVIPGFCQTLSSLKAGVYVVPFMGANNTFGAPKQLVQSSGGNTNYYPSFSPDGKYVLFNRAATDSYDAKDAKMLIVPTAGGNEIDLKAINAQVGNSWPKWAPFAHKFQGSTIFWFTFASRRAFGLRGGTNAQIWMAGVDAGKLGGGADGAFPAFRLPFQDAATGNHIAQWATRVARVPCGISMVGASCGPNEVCVNGRCVPAGP